MREEELERRWQGLISRLMAEGLLRSEPVIKAMRRETSSCHLRSSSSSRKPPTCPCLLRPD